MTIHLNVVPTYQEFLHEHLLSNTPIIIRPSLISAWQVTKHWTTADGLIDWEYLKTAYGWCQVTVADCSTRDFSDQKREQMLFRDVVSLWQEGKGQSLYVKDWHLARALNDRASAPDPNGTGPKAENDDSPPSERAESQEHEPFYTTPDVFRDDWMNAYYSAHTADDFRFVYVGPAGTFTPLHRDVYTSYSWSTNVAGRKRWWLFPPEQTPLLFRKGGEEHLETAFDVRSVDPGVFPLFSQAQPVVVEQGPGETIFVPSGWFHQVENLTPCISINHNWCNAVNLPSLYESMCAKVVEVERALEDVKELLSSSAIAHPHDPQEALSRDSQTWEHEWVAIVQDVVEKDAGWNWLTFWKMVQHALSLALGQSCPINAGLWPRTPRDLMPPLAFIQERVHDCHEEFIRRAQREAELVPQLGDVLTNIRALLDTSIPHNHPSNTDTI